jgi:hypothetical protein
MDQITKEAAVSLLRAHRQATEAQRIKADNLDRIKARLIRDARTHGLPWAEIAHHLGHPNAEAMRQWYLRSGRRGRA